MSHGKKRMGELVVMVPDLSNRLQMVVILRRVGLLPLELVMKISGY